MTAFSKMGLAAVAIAFCLNWSVPAQAQCDECSSPQACPVFFSPCSRSPKCPFGSGQCYGKSGGANVCGVPGSVFCAKCTPTSCPSPLVCTDTATCCLGGKACVLPCSSSVNSPCVATSGCFCDLGNGTIHDACTGRQWEKKTTTPGLHYAYNWYSWAGQCGGIGGAWCQPNVAASITCAAHSDGGTTGCSTCATGTCNVDPHGLGAITTVWDWLNQVNAENFAGHNDWRLPSEGGCNSCYLSGQLICSCSPAELESLLLAPWPCPLSSCIDSIFGPTWTGVFYWSASTSRLLKNG